MMYHMPNKPVPLGCVTALFTLACFAVSGMCFFLWVKLPPEEIEKSHSLVAENLGTFAIGSLVVGVIAAVVSVWHLKSYVRGGPSVRSGSIEM